MKYRKHENAPGIDTIENSVRKSRHVGTAYFASDAAKHVGDTFDRIERGVNRRKEFLP
jgi:hypothetical protein